MLINIEYKYWPKFVYVKYNDEKSTKENLLHYKNELDLLIKKIEEYKEKNDNNDLFIVLNLSDLKTIDLRTMTKNNKLFDKLVKYIKKYIRFIFIVLKNKQIKFLLKFYINFRYGKYKKKFSFFKSKKIVQEHLNNIFKNNYDIENIINYESLNEKEENTNELQLEFQDMISSIIK